MQFNSFPFREYVTVYNSTTTPYSFIQFFFPEATRVNRSSTEFSCLVRNTGDNPVSFYLQTGSTPSAIGSVAVYTPIVGQSYTVAVGGVVNIQYTLSGSNDTLQFMVSSQDEGMLMLEGVASADPVVIRTTEPDYYRQNYYGITTWDTSTSTVSVQQQRSQFVLTPVEIVTTSSGSVAAGKVKVDLELSNNFIGTIQNVSYSGSDTAIKTFEVPSGYQLGQIDYTVTTGSIKVTSY